MESFSEEECPETSWVTLMQTGQVIERTESRKSTSGYLLQIDSFLAIGEARSNACCAVYRRGGVRMLLSPVLLKKLSG